jgi:hypothetical protein
MAAASGDSAGDGIAPGTDTIGDEFQGDFSVAKRGTASVPHPVCAAHLHRYLREFDCR